MGRTTTIVLARTEFVYGTSDNLPIIEEETQELSDEEAFDLAVFDQQVKEEESKKTVDTFHMQWSNATAYLGWQYVDALINTDNRQRNMKMQAETLHFMFTKFLKSCQVLDSDISTRLKHLEKYKSRKFKEFPKTYRVFDIEIQKLVQKIPKKPVVNYVWHIFHNRMRPFLESRAKTVSEANSYFDATLFAKKLDEYFDLFKEPNAAQPSARLMGRHLSRLDKTALGAQSRLF
tara:strand:- start:817 stop:1515 length:699 start_codon:yes stop_codon:yes gene_type:complete